MQPLTQRGRKQLVPRNGPGPRKAPQKPSASPQAVQRPPIPSPPSHALGVSPKSSAGVHWSRQETRTLLAILGEAEYIRQLQTVHRNAAVYRAVSERMRQEGFQRTEHQCRSKFKVLKALYLKASDTQTSRPGEPRRCPFYDTLDHLLGSRSTSKADALTEDPARTERREPNSAARRDAPGEAEGGDLKAEDDEEVEPWPAWRDAEDLDGASQLSSSVSDLLAESGAPEDALEAASGAGCSQAPPGSSSSSHCLLPDAVEGGEARRGVSRESMACTGTNRGPPGPTSPQGAPSGAGPAADGGERTSPRQRPRGRTRRRRRSVASTLALEMAENRKLARVLAERMEERLDRLIAIGEQANAQQGAANQLRREAVVAATRLATAVEGATGALHRGLEKLLQKLMAGNKS
ncbi:zinc finger and SCAN domain containing 29 [Tachyglossus aculeatus]|uniref:zinc finger and SCAN domain containing 29 n=1 Tax=Tachyglossus aculeatus TaxID=9261 RepID=UPI0018F76AE7|nr:zinc finger and SCAN domain containing 29 [Tachyglossus aculeatus]